MTQAANKSKKAESRKQKYETRELRRETAAPQSDEAGLAAP
jgi:hypothetical protein